MQILDQKILNGYDLFYNISIDISDHTLNSNSSYIQIKDEKEKITNKLKCFYDDLLSKILFKTYCLFIVNFSIEWEKKIKQILFLCNFIVEKEIINIGYRKISQLIEKNFKILSESEVYKKINIIREIANEIKHSNLDDYSIFNEHLEELLDIKFDIIDNHQMYKLKNNFEWRNIKNDEKNSVFNERCKLNTIQISGNREEIRKYMKDEKNIDISYIIKSLKFNINDDWIFEEFSFNKKEEIFIKNKHSINYPISVIIFSEDERNKKTEEIEESFKGTIKI